MEDEDGELTLSIGAVARATGVPANTLRTWERRYGFPKPLRTDGGQRAYPASVVSHLIEVSRALDRGLRPRDALTASREELARWATVEDTIDVGETDALFEAVCSLDGVALKRGMRMAWAERGGVACMDEVLGPLVYRMGSEWAEGRLEVYQEHFASEVIRGFLTEQWRPLAETARGPLVVCTTPPGEPHDLGLHFATTTLVLCGRRVRFLGANTPVPDILASSRTEPTEAVVLSISSYADPATTRDAVQALAAELPRSTTLLLGGAGSGALADVPGVVQLSSCAGLQGWARPGA